MTAAVRIGDVHETDDSLDRAAVLRDDRIIDAVAAGDVDHALAIADAPAVVALIAALTDLRRRR